MEERESPTIQCLRRRFDRMHSNAVDIRKMNEKRIRFSVAIVKDPLSAGELSASDTRANKHRRTRGHREKQ